VRLTDISLRQLPVPEKGQRIYFDDTLPSFGCRVSRGGTRSFVIQHGADRQLITIGRYPIISLSEARTEAKRILAECTLGKHRSKSIPFAEALALFIAACEQQNKPRTVKDYTRLLNRHFAFGRTQVSEITPQDINRRLDRLLDTPAEHAHALVVIKIFFNWAFRRHYIDVNPCARLIRPDRAAPRERVLTDTEIVAVFRSAIKGDDNFSFIVALLVLTGQRRSEVAALKREWIDTAERTITLPAAIVKNKRTHTFPFGELVADILGRIPRQGEYLFPAARDRVKGKPATVFNGWGKPKEKFDELCKVSDWQLHDLRRTFASKLAALGVALPTIEKLLNHVSGSFGGVVAVYQRHNWLPEMREAVKIWEQWLQTRIFVDESQSSR
jgi:integrase